MDRTHQELARRYLPIVSALINQGSGNEWHPLSQLTHRRVAASSETAHPEEGEFITPGALITQSRVETVPGGLVGTFGNLVVELSPPGPSYHVRVLDKHDRRIPGMLFEASNAVAEELFNLAKAKIDGATALNSERARDPIRAMQGAFDQVTIHDVQRKEPAQAHNGISEHIFDRVVSGSLGQCVISPDLSDLEFTFGSGIAACRTRLDKEGCASFLDTVNHTFDKRSAALLASTKHQLETVSTQRITLTVGDGHLDAKSFAGAGFSIGLGADTLVILPPIYSHLANAQGAVLERSTEDGATVRTFFDLHASNELIAIVEARILRLARNVTDTAERLSLELPANAMNKAWLDAHVSFECAHAPASQQGIDAAYWVRGAIVEPEVQTTLKVTRELLGTIQGVPIYCYRASVMAKSGMCHASIDCDGEIWAHLFNYLADRSRGSSSGLTLPKATGHQDILLD